MKVSEAIDQLEVGDMVWVRGKVSKKEKAGYPLQLEFAGFTKWIMPLEEISLTTPTAEKVEVSQEFADWVEKVMMWKHDSSWAVKEIAGYGWGAFMHDPGAGDELLPKKYPWVEAVQNNKEKHIKAIYDGYTVKPKRWVVTTTDSDTCYLKRFRMGKECLDGDISKVWVGELGWAFTFTEKSKAEAVATLVEGSVEEV